MPTYIHKHMPTSIVYCMCMHTRNIYKLTLLHFFLQKKINSLMETFSLQKNIM